MFYIAWPGKLFLFEFRQMAAWQDQTEAVKMLLQWGANVNLKTSDELAPIHFAAWDQCYSAAFLHHWP
jgi:hypothetical protein